MGQMYYMPGLYLWVTVQLTAYTDKCWARLSIFVDGLLINPKVINRAIKYLVSSVVDFTGDLQVNIYTCLCYITRNGHIWITVILMCRKRTFNCTLKICQAKKKYMCVYCHMSKKSRVGRSVGNNFFFFLTIGKTGNSRS